MLKKIDAILSKDISVYGMLFVVIFVVGFVLRLKLFLYNPSLCHDEADLALNMIQNDNYFDFFKPLHKSDVVAPAFFILSKFFYSLKDFPTMSPFQSDLLLRIIPFTSGVILIPVFGLLLHKTFKNDFITGIGMAIISCCPLLITFSVTYTQYSLEALVTVIIMLLTISVDYRDSICKNILKFVALGLAPFFSMTALFILPAAILYLFVVAKKENCLKIYFYYLLALIPILLIYYFVFLHYIIVNIYGATGGFWGTFKNLKILNYWICLNWILTSILAVCSSKKIESIILFGGPLLLTSLAIITDNYIASGVTLIFLFPIIVISLLYVLYSIPYNKYVEYKCSFNFLLLMMFVLTLLFQPATEKYRFKNELGREIWINAVRNCKTKPKVIMGKSLSTNRYYNLFLNRYYMSSDVISNDEEWNTIPDERYVYIATDALASEKDTEILTDKSDVSILKKVYEGENSFYVEFAKKQKNINKN